MQNNETNISRGTFGIYLARKVFVDEQELYQPLIDIDGTSGLERQEKIASAITFACLTLKSLSALGVAEHFKFIASGGTGFRAVSNLKLNHPAYKAFVEWMRSEMSFIHDLKPTTETDPPHQIFAYKGDPAHNKKALIDGHSTIIDKNLLEQHAFTVDDYLQMTAGKPDPSEILSFVKWLISGSIISDLKVLGLFGNKLSEYQQSSFDFNVNPFSHILLRKNTEPIGLSALKEMLDEKGIRCTIEKRGNASAISFKGYSCPMCGKTTVNARAYPPSYKLRCFNVKCDPHDGVPLYRWAGIQSNGYRPGSSKNGFDLAVPNKYETLEDACSLVAQELNSSDNSIIVLTPGTGKTRTTLNEIQTMGQDRIVIYAAFNKALQEEAFNTICALAGKRDGFHLIQSREDTCQRSTELKDITRKGFSPSEIICGNCPYRQTSCDYYNQRSEFGPGVYFVTIHMLQYLQSQIPTPDLIILDENVKAGLLLENVCSEIQIQSVLKVVKGTDQHLITDLLNLFHRISINFVSSDSAEPKMIINGRKLTESTLQEATIIELLAKGMNTTEEDIISRLTSLSNTLDNLSRTDLYRQGIDLNAISWIKGLISPTTLSYVLMDKEKPTRFITKQITPLGYPGTPIKVLDATGDASALKSLVRRRLKTVKADVAWNSKRVHIKKSINRVSMDHPQESYLVKLLTDMLVHTQAEKVMFITYECNESQIMKILNEIDLTRTFMGFHFYGPRGINSFQECDAVLVIGLPYPNLNAAAQDACILFPDEKDSDKRIDWTEACMQWELVQCIHRIRPVRKSSVDIILAGSKWPSMLPEPDIIIDQSQNKNWKELAIDRLKPFVDEFGFLTADIGFLANVYVKKKSTIAKQFQANIARLIYDVKELIPELEGECITSTLGCSEDFDSSRYSCFKDVDNFHVDEKIKLILVICNIYIQKSLELKRSLLLRIVNQLKKQSIEWTNDPLILSTTKQWSDLINHFKEINPHFEKFKIKLPHARGNAIDGAGNPDRVKAFYCHINQLEIVGKINLDTYQVEEQSSCPFVPIHAGYISVYMADDEQMMSVAWGSEFVSISLKQEPQELEAFFTSIPIGEDIKIITNNGKQVAKAFLLCGLPKCEIIDVIIAEKLIANGEIEYRALSLKTIFSRYELSDGLERSGLIHRLVEVWSRQEPLIQSIGLTTVFGIETRLIWVTAKIETVGISIDVDALLKLHDELGDKIDALAAELEKSIPPDIPLHDRGKIQEHLNSIYDLSLAKIDEDSLRWISQADVKCLVANLIEYWKTVRELRDVESYMAMTGADDRVRDSIDQLNTKTGRFYRHLQTVQKTGPMRSLFRAREGYKFILADYSQQEARIIAGLSNDQVAIDLFKAGKDIYLETAKIIMGPDVSGDRYRKLGKEIMLGLNNGRSAYSIYESLARLGFGYDLDDVHGMILRYNIEFAGMSAWRDGIKSSAKDDGAISTRLGRMLKVSEDTKVNVLYNHPVQGTAADGFKLALIDLDDQLAGYDAQIVHIIHDEVIVKAREDVADDVAVTVKSCMEQAFKGILPEVPMVVEPVIRDSWR
ncbi:PolA2: predicted DNA polymerase I [Desulfosarcina variabilis str. Montpellier]